MGNIFENEDQFFQTLNIAREERIKGATRMGLFGSRARGNHRPDSDIDIFVESPGAFSLRMEEKHIGDVHLVRANPIQDTSGVNHIRQRARWFWQKDS